MTSNYPETYELDLEQQAILDNADRFARNELYGYIWESEINRLYRSTKLLEIGAGTTEVRKMIIAGELLKDMPHD